MNPEGHSFDRRLREMRVIKRPLYAADEDERARRVEMYTQRLREGKPMWPADDAWCDDREDADQ